MGEKHFSFKSLNSRTDRHTLLFSLMANKLSTQPKLRAIIHKESLTKSISQEYNLYIHIKIHSKLESGTFNVQHRLKTEISMIEILLFRR